MLGLGVRTDATDRRHNLVWAGRRSLYKIVPGGVGISADHMRKNQRHGYQGRERSRWTASLWAHEHSNQTSTNKWRMCCRVVAR